LLTHKVCFIAGGMENIKNYINSSAGTAVSIAMKIIHAHYPPLTIHYFRA
jgi:hypothetical protein